MLLLYDQDQICDQIPISDSDLIRFFIEKSVYHFLDVCYLFAMDDKSICEEVYQSERLKEIAYPNLSLLVSASRCNCEFSPVHILTSVDLLFFIVLQSRLLSPH